MANLLAGLTYPRSAYEQANSPIPLPPVDPPPTFSTLVQTSARQDLPFGKKPVGRTDPSSIQQATAALPAPAQMDLFSLLDEQQKRYDANVAKYIGFDPESEDFAAPSLTKQTPPNAMLMSLADKLDREAAANKGFAAEERAKSPFLRRIFYPLHRQLNEQEKQYQDASAALVAKALATRQAAVEQGIQDRRVTAGILESRLRALPNLQLMDPVQQAAALTELESKMLANTLKPYETETNRIMATRPSGGSGKADDTGYKLSITPIGDSAAVANLLLEEDFVVHSNSLQTQQDPLSTARNRLTNVSTRIAPRVAAGENYSPAMQMQILGPIIQNYVASTKDGKVPQTFIQDVAATMYDLTPTELKSQMAEGAGVQGLPEQQQRQALLENFFIGRAQQVIRNTIESGKPLASLGE